MLIDMRHWNGLSLHPFAVATDQLTGPARQAARFLVSPAQLEQVQQHTKPCHTVFGIPVYVKAESA